MFFSGAFIIYNRNNDSFLPRRIFRAVFLPPESRVSCVKKERTSQ